MRKASRTAILIALCFLIGLPFVTRAQRGAVNGEWRSYGGDAAGTKYSPLDQINAANVNQLQIVWRWKRDGFGPRPDSNWQVTPLMVGDLAVFHGRNEPRRSGGGCGIRRHLGPICLDEGARGAQAPRTNNRGLAYWSNGNDEARILLITPGYHLVELNAKTGKPVPSLGKTASWICGMAWTGRPMSRDRLVHHRRRWLSATSLSLARAQGRHGATIQKQRTGLHSGI